MIQIAADLAKLYTSFMEQKGVETDQRQNKKSLSAFLEKLKEKKQAESLRGAHGYAHVFMRFVYRIEIIDALKPIVHLFELPCLPLTDLVPISSLL